LAQQRYLAWLRWVVVVNLLLLAFAVTWHFVDLAVLFPNSPDYFARRDPL